MRTRICGVTLGLWLLAVSASAQAQPTVGTLCQSSPGVWEPCGASGGGGSFNGLLLDAASGDPITDTANDALRVNVVAGSASGTTDADDASIAAGQTGLGLNASLSMAFDGTVWRRLTFGTAGTASAQVLTIQGVASMTPVQVSQATAASLNATVVGTGTFATQVDGAALTALQLIDNIPITIGSTTSGQSGALVMGAVTTSAPTYTTAQSHPLSLDTTGSLRVAITSGAGSGGTALADDADFTAGTTSFTPFGGFYQSTVTACTDGDACAARVTAGRAVTVALVNPDGSAATYATDATVGTAAPTTGPLINGIYKEFDGSALPTTTNVNTEGEASPVATSLQGVQYVMLVSEDGSLERGTSTTPMVVGDGSGALNTIIDSGTVTTVSTVTSVSQLGGSAVPVEDAAETAGGTGVYAMAVRRDTLASSAGTTGDNTTLNSNERGALYVQPTAGVNGGADALSYISAGSTEDEHAVKATAGTLYSITVTNTNAAVRYLKCENDTAANTAPGTDTPEFRMAIPGATTGAGFTTSFPMGWSFSTALTCWLVTGAADSDVAEVAANEIMVFYTYR